VQAAVRALAAEGRAFAQTEEGRRWKERLREAPLVQRLQTIWEGVSDQAFTADGPEVVPTVLLERLVQVAKRDQLEALISQLFEARA
jgi:hypothetical protein